MISRSFVVLASTLIVGSSTAADVHYGIVNLPTEQAMTEDAGLQAIHSALAPEEKSCGVELLSHSEPKPSSDGKVVREQVAVSVCGTKETFDVRRIRMKEDRTMITAKRI